jgi:hypothetical protein
MFGKYVWRSTRDADYAAYRLTNTLLAPTAPEPLNAFFAGIFAVDPAARPTAEQAGRFVEANWVQLVTHLRQNSNSTTTSSATGPVPYTPEPKKTAKSSSDYTGRNSPPLGRNSPALGKSGGKRRTTLGRAWKALSKALSSHIPEEGT